MRALPGIWMLGAAACLWAAGCGGGGAGPGVVAGGLVGRLVGAVQDVLRVTVGAEVVRVSPEGEVSLDAARTGRSVPVAVSLADGGQVVFYVRAPAGATGSVALDVSNVGAESRAEGVEATPRPSEGAGRAWITGLARGDVVRGTPTAGAAYFEVSGRAALALSSPGTLYGVYLLVYPYRALGEGAGWYVQFPNVTVNPASGAWSPPGRGQIGDDEWPAVPGERFALCAVVAARSSVGAPRRMRVATPQEVPGVVAISPIVEDLIYQPVRAVVIYGETLEGAWEDWSWDATRDLNSTAQAHSGSRSIQVSLGPWGGLSFGTRSPLDLRSYGWLSFWIHGGTAGGQRLRLLVHDVGDTLLPGPGGLPLNDSRYLERGTVEPGRWKPARIPLVDLGAASAVVKQISLTDATGQGQAAFHVDEVSLAP